MVGVITGIKVFGSTARFLANSKPIFRRIRVLRVEITDLIGFTP